MTSVADLIGADGAAGQPQVLQTAARDLDQAGGEVARLRASLGAVEAAEWRSQARVRFDKLRDATIDQDLAPIDQHYDAAVSALRTYGHRLDEIQDRARGVAHALTAEQEKLETNRRDEDIAGGLVSAAKVAAAVTTLAPPAKVAADYALKEAKEHQHRMRAQTAATQQRITRLRGEGSDLRAELDVAARTCVAALNGLRPPAGQAHLTPVEMAAGGAAVVGTAIGAIRRFRPGANGRGIDWGARGRENKLREIWNSTPGRPSGPNAISNSRIAELARDRAARGGHGGQCLQWVHDIINHDGQLVKGFGFNTATYQEHWSKVALEVPSIDEAVPGDIVQWQSPDGSSVHTMIIIDSGPPVKVADSNSRWNEQLAIGNYADRVSGKGDWVRIWRVGQV
ncbi:MAG: hypothetical protein JHD16_01155 [Solirubrobacteraceae bacterium]|nr:hypothetical protein [Solirubrobacteraceae bacterium]